MQDLSPSERMPGRLLAVVGVERGDRVVCQAAGCGHGVYRRIHVVRLEDGSVQVFGSDCFERLFGHFVDRSPRYGSSEGRELSAEERVLLVQNTEQLIARFESEHQDLEEKARQQRERQADIDRVAQERLARLKAEADRRRALTPAEFASVEQEAKAIVRQKLAVDPDAPGWRGLVMIEARKLLGRAS